VSTTSIRPSRTTKSSTSWCRGRSRIATTTRVRLGWSRAGRARSSGPGEGGAGEGAGCGPAVAGAAACSPRSLPLPLRSRNAAPPCHAREGMRKRERREELGRFRERPGRWDCRSVRPSDVRVRRRAGRGQSVVRERSRTPFGRCAVAPNGRVNGPRRIGAVTTGRSKSGTAWPQWPHPADR
jgi:hypothetical protein